MLSRESLQNSSCFAVMTAFGLAFIAWGGTQLYVTVCAPSGFYGFLYSLVAMDSSPCQALFSLVNHSQTFYAATVSSLLFALFAFLTSWVARSEQTLGGPKRPSRLIPPDTPPNT